ncbi:MAG TPA: hypothetical protein DCM62_02870 [Bacteroidales bacterium]|nr:hypothetical protein [Bacteroidales bacterium]
MDPDFQTLADKLPLQSLPVIGFFRNYPVDKFYFSNQFYLICGTSDNQWAYLCGQNPEDLIEVLQKFAFATLYFANVENWMLPAITQTHRIDWKLTTHRFFLPDTKDVLQPTMEYASLDISMAETIYRLSAYKDFTSVAYIKDRLSKDISAGIWQNGELVGWGLTHDDNSLGFLNVLPQWQGKGLGENLMKALILQKRNQNLPVFVNIEPHNVQSLNLVQKLGFVFDRQVSWLKLA